METCSNDPNSENDTHIITLMGSSDLNLVDTSMLPTDPRAMMDLVPNNDVDEDSISTTFQSHFQNSSSNGHPLSAALETSVTSPFQNGGLTHSPPMSALTCSVSLSSSLIRSASPSPGASSLHSPLGQNNHNLSGHQQLRLQQPLPMLQIGLTSPSQESTHSNQDLSSPPLDRGNDVLSSRVGSIQQILPLPMHTPPMHQGQEFSLFSPVQAADSTIQRPYPGNGYQTLSAGTSYIPSGMILPTLDSSSAISPSVQRQPQNILKSEKSNFYILSHQLKQEDDDDYLQNNDKRLLTTAPPHTLEHSPYMSLANLNINNERISGTGSIGLRSHRNPSGDGSISHSPIVSPMRNPSDSSDAICASPNDITLRTRVHPRLSYGLASPPGPIGDGLEMTHHNNGRDNLTVPVHMQHHQEQPQLHQHHLFQPIHLHATGGPINISSNQFSAHEFVLDDPLDLGSSSYDEPLVGDPLSSATRNLSFNYGDATASQSESINHPQPYTVINQYPTKSNAKTSGRRMTNEPYRQKGMNISNNDQEEECSSDAQSNYDSDEDTLLINTSGSSNDNSGFECGECKSVFRTRGGLRKHLTAEHFPNEPEPTETLPKKYHCSLSLCEYVTMKRGDYDDHIAIHISEGWTPTGKKRHNNKTPLQRHRYNKEEFQCPHCEYSCTVEKAFNRHLEAHRQGLDESEIADKLSCQICGKDRANEASLRNHMERHKKGNFFKCDICKFQSVQLKKLIQHRRMHTGEKPHLCPFCSYRAARRDNLRSHVRRMHKKKNMFCDTFTPRPLVKAQLDVCHGNIAAQQHQHQQQQQQTMMGLSQHPSASQIPMMERIQHHQQINQQILGGMPPQGLGVGPLSAQEMDLNPEDSLQMSTEGGIFILPQGSQHNHMPSP
ncbi:UNVERIFIED_CONTAM: hypothetical protein RMT77_012576 [Armadillidium vulgare]